jgi:hypothetical protein
MSIVPHIPRTDPTDGPATREVIQDLAALVRSQGERLEARRRLRTETIARAERAVARARLVQERTATLLARLESTWEIGPGRARQTAASPPRWQPTGLSAGPASSPNPSDSPRACRSSMSVDENSLTGM